MNDIKWKVLREDYLENLNLKVTLYAPTGCEKFLESWKKQKKNISPNGLYMKMLKECCLLAEDSTSCQSSLKWTDSGTMQNGKLSIQDGMFRKIGSAYTLSDIIEEDADPRYFLSREMAERIVQGN